MSQRLPWKKNLCFTIVKSLQPPPPKNFIVSETIFSLRHNPLIWRLSSNCLISQDCFLASFLIKSSKLDANLILSPYAPDLCLWQIHRMASPWSALSGLFLSRYYQEASSWSQPPKPAKWTRFRPLLLWIASLLSFLLSLLSSTLPCPLASFLKFTKLLFLQLLSKVLPWRERTKELPPCLYHSSLISLKNCFFFRFLNISL